MKEINSMNRSTMNMLLKVNCEAVSDVQEEVSERLETFTLCANKPIAKLLYEMLSGSIYYDKEKKKYHYEDNDNSFDFELYSDKVVEKDIIRNLCSMRRYKNSINNSFCSVLGTLGEHKRLLIGLSQDSNGEYIHSIVEDIDDYGEKFIYDFSKNLKMKAEDYYSIFKFKELNRVSKKEIENDYEYFLSKLGSFSVPIYLLFRNEMIDDLKRRGIIKLEKYVTGINKNTFDMLLSDRDNYEYDRYLDSVQNTIDVSTMGKKYKQKLLNMRKVANMQFISDDKKSKIIKYDDGIYSIKYKKLSSIVDNKKLRETLESFDRYGHCHMGTSKLAHRFYDSKITNAYINAEGADILHSVLEYEEDGEVFIIDYTLNLVMRKKDYEKIMNLRILGSATVDELNNEYIKLLNDAVGYIDPIIYICFKDEIHKDLEKNKKVLNLKLKGE